MLLKEISLYVHIPFCMKKCNYCDFNSVDDFTFMSQYIKALIREMESYAPRELKVRTLYIGGGTPTIFSAKQLHTLIESVYANFELVPGAEFTLEANPGTLTLEKLEMLKALGVNRISLGLQAYQDHLLKALGRIHSVEDFEENYFLLRELGFSNINVDLMFGLPGQGKEDFEDSLKKLLRLSPEHISCYSLIIEEGTPFFDLYEREELLLPSEDEERAMYHHAISYLRERGYRHYEISNFAKDGRRSEHNLVYWKCEEYLGLGAGSHSYLDGQRFYNHPSLTEYIGALSQGRSPVAQVQKISWEEQLSEYCIMGLRLMEGIDKIEFFDRFGIDIKNVFGTEVAKLKDRELLEENPRNIKLTAKGLDFANDVFVEFLR